MLVVQLDQAGAAHVGVDLRRGDIGVSEHGLHRAQIGATLDQVGGKRMPQLVWRDLTSVMPATRA